MMNNNPIIFSIDLERLLQLIELSDRLVKMGYASRTEKNFVENISKEIIKTLEDAEKKKKEEDIGEYSTEIDNKTIDVVS